MLELDGSTGGGQLVRTALSLAAITGRSFRMTGVRGGRDTPGLRPQHLAAVRTMAAICDADVAGAEAGATEIEFRPDEPRSGTYRVDIGTAGSVTLLFDAVLPLTVAIDGPLRLTATGGTDVRWAPPIAFHRAVKLPLLRRFGVPASLDRSRSGFYPAGDGTVTLTLAPGRVAPLSIVSRGEPMGARVYSACSADLADRDVAVRQADSAVDRLADAGLSPVERHVSHVPSASTGSVICVRLDFEATIAGFDALGERGTPAEAVGAAAADDAVTFLDSTAAVDRHLADQLLPFLALAGGRVAVPAITEHVSTVRALLDRFGYPVSIEEDRTGLLVRAD